MAKKPFNKFIEKVLEFLIGIQNNPAALIAAMVALNTALVLSLLAVVGLALWIVFTVVSK